MSGKFSELFFNLEVNTSGCSFAGTELGVPHLGRGLKIILVAVIHKIAHNLVITLDGSRKHPVFGLPIDAERNLVGVLWPELSGNGNPLISRQRQIRLRKLMNILVCPGVGGFDSPMFVWTVAE